ncbi:MAG: tryptophan synthase subunit alpha [Bdellovibrionales bacterium]|nr:tryptophan synthase subunit alpha [Bdellovibrionales bacterium]
MTERVKNLFSDSSRRPLLSIFYTAGYPELDSTAPIFQILEKSGVDFVELGIPFSDPIADGPVIQQSSAIALDNGMNVAKVIAQVREIRESCEMPIFLMGYLNPALQYGFERFLDDISEAGADGVILPDLPLLDYERKYREEFEKRNLSNVFLITPQTPEERIRKLDELSTGFLYVVSSPSITGSKLQMNQQRDEYLSRVQGYNLKNPLIVGFGISDRESFLAVTQYTAGAIIGTAFIRLLEEHGIDERKIEEYIFSVKGVEA